MKKILLPILAAVFCLSILSCARQPDTKQAINIMESYFHKYAKKYPSSVVGSAKLKDIQLLHLEEVHKNLVAAYALLELENGMAIQTRFTILRKNPFGWRAVSWENLGMGTRKE